MSDPKTCANPACSCVPAEKEKYCSPHCEALEGETEISCECGHPSCKGEASTL
jgi:metallothionein